MTQTIINRFNGSNLMLIKENDNYFAVDRDDANIRYDLSNHWKYTGTDKRYLKESTKTRIIKEARARTQFSSDIQEFINWYDKQYVVADVEIVNG